MKTITVREASNRIGGGSVEGQFYGYVEYRKVAKSLADPS